MRRIRSFLQTPLSLSLLMQPIFRRLHQKHRFHLKQSPPILSYRSKGALHSRMLQVRKTKAHFLAFPCGWQSLLAGGFAVILGAGIFLFLHNRQKEQEDLMRRRQRRLERLEDMGFSSSDFDQMLSKKRSSIPSYRPRRRTKGRSFRKNRRR